MRKDVLLLSIVVLSGCGRNKYWFNDDIDINFDLLLAPFGYAGEDAIRTPYVSGAPVRMWAITRNDNGFDGFSVRSADNDVLSVTNGVVEFDVVNDWALLSFDAAATGPGTTEIELLKENGDIADTLDIDVRRPNRIELHAAGPQYVGVAFPSLVDEPQVLTGGLATFEVNYFDGDTRLFGNNVLEAGQGAQTEVTVEQSWFFENREWLQIRAGEPGPDSVPITVDGEDLGAVTIDSVPPEAIVDVRLFATPETRKTDDGDALVVLAQAFDAADEPIFGAEYAWELSGVEEAGVGDLYRYDFDEDAENTLRADFLELSDQVTIHGDGRVDSSNNIGCNSAGLPAAWALVSAAALLLRRRQG